MWAWQFVHAWMHVLAHWPIQCPTVAFKCMRISLLHAVFNLSRSIGATIVVDTYESVRLELVWFNAVSFQWIHYPHNLCTYIPIQFADANPFQLRGYRHCKRNKFNCKTRAAMQGFNVCLCATADCISKQLQDRNTVVYQAGNSHCKRHQ